MDEELDRRIPCKLCREPAAGAGGGYCMNCLINNYVEIKRFIFPVSIKDIEEKWNRKKSNQ